MRLYVCVQVQENILLCGQLAGYTGQRVKFLAFAIRYGGLFLQLSNLLQKHRLQPEPGQKWVIARIFVRKRVDWLA
jgi:hypothetical protein